MSAPRPNPLPPDETRGPLLLQLTCILTAISFTFTAVRCWVRKANYQLGWDDYTIGLCSILSVIRMGLQIEGVKRGNGRHIWYLSHEEYVYISQSAWMTQLFLFTMLCLMKCSICLLVMRIQNSKRLKWILWALMCGLFITNGTCIVILLSECKPIPHYWQRPKGANCWSPKPRIYSIYIQIGYSVISDLACSLLPVAVVWRVKIDLKTKAAVCFLMGLGLVATACAAVRASSLGLDQSDVSWTLALVACWANLELHVGIIAANLSLSRMIYLYFRSGGRPMGSSSNSRTPHSGYINQSSGLDGGRRGTGLRSMQGGNNTTNTICRRASFSRSEDSDIPLDPQIKKTTEVFVTESAVGGGKGGDMYSNRDGISSKAGSDLEYGRH